MSTKRKKKAQSTKENQAQTLCNSEVFIPVDDMTEQRLFPELKFISEEIKQWYMQAYRIINGWSDNDLTSSVIEWKDEYYFSIRGTISPIIRGQLDDIVDRIINVIRFPDLSCIKRSGNTIETPIEYDCTRLLKQLANDISLFFEKEVSASPKVDASASPKVDASASPKVDASANSTPEISVEIAIPTEQKNATISERAQFTENEQSVLAALLEANKVLKLSGVAIRASLSDTPARKTLKTLQESGHVTHKDRRGGYALTDKGMKLAKELKNT